MPGVARIADGTSNTLLGLARAAGVTVVAGPASPNAMWTGPIVQATPQGSFGPGLLLPAV